MWGCLHVQIWISLESTSLSKALVGKELGRPLTHK